MMMIRRVVLSILFYPQCRNVRRRSASFSKLSFLSKPGFPRWLPIDGNILAFLTFLQDRSEIWAATVTLGATNHGRGIIWLFALVFGRGSRLPRRPPVGLGNSSGA
jgi:hypothetical protein